MADELTRSPAESASALPAGTRLGEFEILSLLGVGGFGIVYLAFDHQLEREVAVKEYMPASMAGRTETMHVSLRSKSDAEIFALGLRSFVNEAKLLARFDHPSLIKVHRFWEANGTAYIAMPVLLGRTLKEIRQGRQSLESPIDERWLRGILDPLLGALELLHSQGVYHRDIAPDNIKVEPDGHPVLLDFGAARRVISDKTQTLTAILKPAYAPIEQYAEAGGVKQGPWTDLYALGATLHYMLLARPPEPATARAVSDDATPLAGQKIDGCGESFLHIVDWMLAPRPTDRPQSVAALRAVLDGKAPLPQRRPADAVSAAQWEPTVIVPSLSAAPKSPAEKAVPVAPVAPPATEPTPAPAQARDDDITVVIAPKSGSGARSASPGATPPPAAPPAPAMPPVAPAAPAAPKPAVVQAVAAPMPAAAGAQGSTKRLVPVALGAVVVVAIAAFAFWPRASDPPAGAAMLAAPANEAASAATPAPGATSVTTPVTTPVAAQAPVESSAPSPAPAPGASPAPVSTASPTPLPPKATPPVETPLPKATPTATTSAPTLSSTSPSPGIAPAAAPGAVPRAETTATPTTTPPVRPPATTPATPATPPPLVGPAPEPPKTPEGNCGNRNALSYFVCMERECRRAEFKAHPECVKWHQQAAPRD